MNTRIEVAEATPTAKTASEAVREGSLVHFNPVTALEAGYSLPVLLSRAAYGLAVEWTRDGEEIHQSMDTRFWDVLSVARDAGRECLVMGNAVPFLLARIPNADRSGAPSSLRTPEVVTLVAAAAAFDNEGAQCLVISTEDES